jgi:DNA-binding NarL/FixJ family response regulator
MSELIPTFTAREETLLPWLALGESNKFIAYELGISESTVKVHVKNIMLKARVHNRTKLAVLLINLRQSNET